MIKQSLTFNDILEKKFKILRTSIMLGNLKNREDALSEYEETAREIDKIRKNFDFIKTTLKNTHFDIY